MREADDRAGRQHDFCAQVLRSNRRCWSIPDGKCSASYLGLTPGEHSSSHLAGRDHVHPGEVQHVGDRCPTSLRPCSNDQPTSRGGNRVGHVMASDPRIAWTMSPRFAAPLTDFNLCASSANTRFGCQLFPWPAGERLEAQRSVIGRDLSLTGGPLHTRGHHPVQVMRTVTATRARGSPGPAVVTQ